MKSVFDQTSFDFVPFLELCIREKLLYEIYNLSNLEKIITYQTIYLRISLSYNLNGN